MKKRLSFMLVVLIALAFVLVSAWKYQTPLTVAEKIPGLKQDVQFGKLPLYFIPNRGQVNDTAKFYAKTSGYTLWMTKEGLVFDSIKEINGQRPKEQGERDERRERDVSRLVFRGANPGPEMAPVDVTQHKVNFLIGSDPSKWLTDIQTAKAVMYKNIYQNIDLKVYGIEKQIEYDWIVKPGGNPQDIRIEYKNVKGTRIDEQGNLLIETGFGELMHKKPVSYQTSTAQGEGVGAGSQTCPKNRRDINVTFKKLAENTYGFEVGAYDRSRELIIDPMVLVYSTFLGGSNKDHNFGLTIDAGGSVYLTGDTYSDDFPTHNGYKNTFNGGGMDAFVTKFSPDGDDLVFSTYLGGSRNDVGECIKVDSNGKVYVTGITYSFNFPTLNAYQKANAGGMDDAFVAVLSASGSSLVSSTYFGGNGQDEAFGIALDSSNNMYIAGRTSSTNFPTVNAYKSTFGGGELDAFVAKFSSSGSSLIYSTYLGGIGTETAYGIAVSGNNAYATGRTSSINFPTLNEYQGTFGGGEYDAFITKLSASGTSVIYSSYLGGSLGDTAYDVAVDSTGKAYVTGDTYGANFPTKNAYQASHGGDKDIFLTRFAASGNTMEYSTFLGGVEADTASHVVLDGVGNIYLTGATRSSNFPVKRAIQNSFNGNLDAFVAMLSADGQSLNLSTYLGGGNYDSGRGIAVDKNGNIYLSGYTESSDFPTEAPYQKNMKGTMDGYVCKISAPGLGTLCGAVDNCDLTWTTGGSANWFEQTDTAYYDDDAAQSGAIGNSQSTFIQTTVTGPGILSFRWSVSSESYYDSLAFYIDSNLQNKISGSVVWEQQTYILPSGTYSLKWSYEKDSSSSGGSDCGWLDKVEYTSMPEIALNRTQLTFGSFPAGTTGPQTFTVRNKTDSKLNWSLTTDQNWITCTPTSGTNFTEVTVSVDPAGFFVGAYTGTITITDSFASNSPQTVTVTLNVYQSGGVTAPFGDYATPSDGATVSSSVPFSGWVLDDLGVESVKLYRQSGDALVFIGDALFVEGARPDVETAYPSYPYNYKAGWGYMMLTNFLPNGGNGTFTIVAKVVDVEGNEVTLGSKTITVDNAHAVKPFGAMDNPAQGGTASGTAFKNQGWVLTPLPNTVPKNGSTIDVYVDGVKLGQTVYNIYRPDIASLFPGYNNSNGAHAYFYFDTTVYNSGIHTIVWVAKDDAANADGIGSRYFTIKNATESAVSVNNPQFLGEVGPGAWSDNRGPVGVIKGYTDGDEVEPQRVYPNEQGMIPVEIRELERIELHFKPDSQLFGYLKVGEQLRALPIGSSLDPGKGIFYWQVGPGFVGEYCLVFVETGSNGDMTGKNILVSIVPKF
ncbi:MAG: hypothetical protein QG657_3845 [Acidobacteriota bacterium]|nr:hypothetical protein [Acidobacteriota bacterium]